MAELRAAAKLLVQSCLQNKIEFPKSWKLPKVNQACRATLMLYNTDTGFDSQAALDYMKQKYGTMKQISEGRARRKRQRKDITEPGISNDSYEKDAKKRSTRRSNSDCDGGGGGNPETSPDFSPKKYEIVTVEDNRPLVEAMKELGVLHFRANEPKKGIHYMVVVKGLRECDHPISDRETSLKIRGVGKLTADHIEEFLKTGDIKHFEELRKLVHNK